MCMHWQFCKEVMKPKNSSTARHWRQFVVGDIEEIASLQRDAGISGTGLSAWAERQRQDTLSKTKK